MNVLLPFLFLFSVGVNSELHDYEDLRKLTPNEYLEQFDLIVDDTSVCEEETNRKLVVLSSHFDEQYEFRRTLNENSRALALYYKAFLDVTQRIYEAKHSAQKILADRTQNAQIQYDAAVKLDKKYPMEMSALLDICFTLGYNNTQDIIASSLRDKPKTQKLAANLEEYVSEAQYHGYAIAQSLHDDRYISRRDRHESRQSFLKKYPKAMTIHDHILGILTNQKQTRYILSE